MNHQNTFKQRLCIKILLFFLCFVSSTIYCLSQTNITANNEKPKIINLINFIRLLEPRDSAITQDVLYQTVVQQVKMMRKYKLGGTFLLQYDALLDNRYQNLLKKLSKDSFEVGAWWEIPQPLVEKAGLVWRGRYPWDWYADVGFSTGYSPKEREQLVDVYMADFKKIFGYYPKSVGSWFIDAHTLNYLYNKYHIIASCNCKDQYGTDGYTLWGGYWSGAYYPSKINSYMPAQQEQNQTRLPIFRMLGSDPVRQYDNGLGSNWQGVVTLEPVYNSAGGDSAWVYWYFDQFVKGECMNYAYAQAGQENSFTWDAMSKGFAIQLPLIARLRDAGQVQVTTLAASGKWFTNHYNTTPATSVTVTKDIAGSNRKTVWFNSRFYRANLYWNNGTLSFRDVHLFDENFPSFYTEGKATSNECSFYTLPLVDGYLWSKGDQLAGLHFAALQDGKVVSLQGGNPVVKSTSPKSLSIEWPLKTVAGKIQITMTEKEIMVRLQSKQQLNWFLDLSAPDATKLPLIKIEENKVQCAFENFSYSFGTTEGSFSQLHGSSVLRMKPKNGVLSLHLVANKNLEK